MSLSALDAICAKLKRTADVKVMTSSSSSSRDADNNNDGGGGSKDCGSWALADVTATPDDEKPLRAEVEKLVSDGKETERERESGIEIAAEKLENRQSNKTGDVDAVSDDVEGNLSQKSVEHLESVSSLKTESVTENTMRETAGSGNGNAGTVENGGSRDGGDAAVVCAAGARSRNRRKNFLPRCVQSSPAPSNVDRSPEMSSSERPATSPLSTQSETTPQDSNGYSGLEDGAVLDLSVAASIKAEAAMNDATTAMTDAGSYDDFCDGVLDLSTYRKNITNEASPRKTAAAAAAAVKADLTSDPQDLRLRQQPAMDSAAELRSYAASAMNELLNIYGLTADIAARGTSRVHSPSLLPTAAWNGGRRGGASPTTALMSGGDVVVSRRDLLLMHDDDVMDDSESCSSSSSETSTHNGSASDFTFSRRTAASSNSIQRTSRKQLQLSRAECASKTASAASSSTCANSGNFQQSKNGTGSQGTSFDQTVPDYNEYIRKYIVRFNSVAECGSSACRMKELKEHFHCTACTDQAYVRKEEIIRHFKWHKKRDDSLQNGFLRFSPLEDCSKKFPSVSCLHNGRHTHYHCLQEGCCKVYISTSDVQMHANFHRKDSAIIQEGFQRFRATENCHTPSCIYSEQKTTHFHCRRPGCSFTFKNKSDMEKHKVYHQKDEVLARDGFKKFMKYEQCQFTGCPYSHISNHIHCIRQGCNYVLHSSGQLFSHKRKHERCGSLDRGFVKRPRTEASDNKVAKMSSATVHQPTVAGLQQPAAALLMPATITQPTVATAGHATIPITNSATARAHSVVPSSNAAVASAAFPIPNSPVVVSSYPAIAASQPVIAVLHPSVIITQTPSVAVVQPSTAAGPGQSVGTVAAAHHPVTPAMHAVLSSSSIAFTTVSSAAVHSTATSTQPNIAIVSPNNVISQPNVPSTVAVAASALTNLVNGNTDLKTSTSSYQNLAKMTTVKTVKPIVIAPRHLLSPDSAVPQPDAPLIATATATNADTKSSTSSCQEFVDMEELVMLTSLKTGKPIVVEPKREPVEQTTLATTNLLPVPGSLANLMESVAAKYHDDASAAALPKSSQPHVPLSVPRASVATMAVSPVMSLLSTPSLKIVSPPGNEKKERDEAWKKCLTRYTANDVCQSRCPLLYKDHYHCIQSGCGTLFRSKDGVRDHAKLHEQQDRITSLVFNTYRENEPCNVEHCQYSNKRLHYHCNWADCTYAVSSAHPVFARLEHYKVHGYGTRHSSSAHGDPSKRKRGRPPKLLASSLPKETSVKKPDLTEEELFQRALLEGPSSPIANGFVRYGPGEPCPDNRCIYLGQEHYHCARTRCHHVEASAEFLASHVRNFHAHIVIAEGFEFFDSNVDCRRAKCHARHGTIGPSGMRHFHCVRPHCDYTFVRQTTMAQHECKHRLSEASIDMCGSNKSAAGTPNRLPVPIQPRPTVTLAGDASTANLAVPLLTLPFSIPSVIPDQTVVSSSSASAPIPLIVSSFTVDSTPLYAQEPHTPRFSLPKGVLNLLAKRLPPISAAGPTVLSTVSSSVAPLLSSGLNVAVASALPDVQQGRLHHSANENCGRPFCKLKKRDHYHCSDCSSAFSDFSRLQVHMVRHRGMAIRNLTDIGVSLTTSQSSSVSLTTNAPSLTTTGRTGTSVMHDMQPLHVPATASCPQPVGVDRDTEVDDEFSAADKLNENLFDGEDELNDDILDDSIDNDDNNKDVDNDGQDDYDDDDESDMDDITDRMVIDLSAAGNELSEEDSCSGKTTQDEAQNLSKQTTKASPQIPLPSSAKQPMPLSLHVAEPDDVVLGYSRFKFSEECGISLCTYRGSVTHYHCRRSDCAYAFCDRSRFAPHADRHRRIDAIAGHMFDQCHAKAECSHSADCLLAARGATHYHCRLCSFVCTDATKVAAHRKRHLRLDRVSAYGFRRYSLSEDCGDAACVSRCRAVHYHCQRIGCGYVATGPSQMAAHRARHDSNEQHLVLPQQTVPLIAP